MKIIPAIDIIDGKCVRLSQEDYDQKTIYAKDPLEMAKRFEDHGLTRLHLVDLDGAKAKHIVNYDVLNRITQGTSLKVDFGGGLKSDEDLNIAFDNGAQQVTGGSIAVTSPDLFEKWLGLYGPERIILGADVKGQHIAIHGWKETSELLLMDFLENYVKKGIRYVICTDIARDGMLAGAANNLYEKILKKFPTLKLIASGGVSSVKDLEHLRTLGLWGAITGKAIYEGHINLKEIGMLGEQGEDTKAPN